MKVFTRTVKMSFREVTSTVVQPQSIQCLLKHRIFCFCKYFSTGSKSAKGFRRFITQDMVKSIQGCYQHPEVNIRLRQNTLVSWATPEYNWWNRCGPVRCRLRREVEESVWKSLQGLWSSYILTPLHSFNGTVGQTFASRLEGQRRFASWGCTHTSGTGFSC
jgi:hypothetical protein